MKKYLSQLRPLERRLVVGVTVGLVLVLNWAFVWPYFGNWANYQNRRLTAERKLTNYRAIVAQIPELKKQLEKYQQQGVFVPPDEQSVNFIRTIQQQSVESGVVLQNAQRPTTKTNDVFFVEQILNINVLAEEKNLVDFLYRLGSKSSMIRVRDLMLQPDPPHQRLSADIRLVASYQKHSTAPASKTATAKAK